jgi:chemotaxis protein methyltransferase WspC
MKRIETLLRRTLGLEVASVGPAAVERLVRRRMKALGFEDLTAYAAHVSADPAEWEELLEGVVVTETWFFRDQSPFQAFVQMAQQELQLRAAVGTRNPELRSGPLRVLSVPCSTGEEPYSLVMALRDAGVAGHRFTIEAVDISARALARAQLGRYGRNSFRGKALEFRDRHFTVGENGFLLNREVRESVRFARGNLLEEKFIANRPPYDFVFCRNLLIYFNRVTQQRALQCLRRLLTPSGVLFVGPAELPLVSEHGFTPIGLPMSFACQRSSAAGADVGERVATRAGRQPSPPVLSAMLPVVVESQTRGPRAKPDNKLAEARALADAGQLEQAAALCKAQVKSQGPSAAAYYLLGLVCDAAGDPSAMDYYRKALYLEPDHYETLLQMALLLERNGDRAGAKTFKRRAQRLEPKN